MATLLLTGPVLNESAYENLQMSIDEYWRLLIEHLCGANVESTCANIGRSKEGRWMGPAQIDPAGFKLMRIDCEKAIEALGRRVVGMSTGENASMSEPFK